MKLDSRLNSWIGFAFRHIPSQSPYHVLDFRFASLADNRWNYPGTPTLYLASDHSVVLAEFARQLGIDRSPEIARHSISRELFCLGLSVNHILDLREPSLWEALSLEDAPHCFLDKSIARAVSQYLRHTTDVQALIVPSMAFLDQTNRWIMVVFLEKLPAEPTHFVSSVAGQGSFHISS